jgi:hypothetical protein
MCTLHMCHRELGVVTNLRLEKGEISQMLNTKGGRKLTMQEMK